MVLSMKVTAATTGRERFSYFWTRFIYHTSRVRQVPATENLCVLMYVFLSVLVYRQSERETERDREREIDYVFVFCVCECVCVCVCVCVCCVCACARA